MGIVVTKLESAKKVSCRESAVDFRCLQLVDLTWNMVAKCG